MSTQALLAALHAWLDDAPPNADDEDILAALHEACLSMKHRLETKASRKRPRPPETPSGGGGSGNGGSSDEGSGRNRGACGMSGGTHLESEPVYSQSTRGSTCEDSRCPPRQGELILLGSGLKAMCHLTREAMSHLQAADVVFGALQPGGPDRRWLELAIGRPVVDLNQFYPSSPHVNRAAAYVQGAEAALREVRRGSRVCVIEYGHPCCAAAMSELLVREARRGGHAVTVLPGISSIDMLSADLGVDPSVGCLVSTADALLRSEGLRAVNRVGLEPAPHQLESLPILTYPYQSLPLLTNPYLSLPILTNPYQLSWSRCPSLSHAPSRIVLTHDSGSHSVR